MAGRVLCVLAVALFIVSCSAGDSCVGRCGNQPDSKYDCECNSHCTRFNDCCDDYKSHCLPGCAGRCGQAPSNNHHCQCNSHCVRFGDCCQDYQTLCTSHGSSTGGSTGSSTGGSTGSGSGSHSNDMFCNSIKPASSSGTPPSTSGSGCRSMTLKQVTEELWRNDVNRLGCKDLTVNYQAKIGDGSKNNAARYKLFTNATHSKMNGETFKTFKALLNNYVPAKGAQEHVTSHELQEEEAFLDAIFRTSVMKTLQNYLICSGSVRNHAELRERLIKMWFDLYPRSGSGVHDDTSGFEHIMVGEYKSRGVASGYHSWIAFYEDEKDGELDYFGYVQQKPPGVIGAAFDWNGHVKDLGSFFIGVSPEFDMAIYSLCFIKFPGRSCHISLNNNDLTIQTYSKDQHIATAFVRT
ncbi:poly(U)-specific endoribonuclease-A [Aplysia californica]|uniref:Uridylate-specific endoribonuclease n=1 Tax=Aplysia californica TaxID=6500 RepID=A0ABM1A135_APLCA|nr:poly(U)-specific endoribonuclease-A [Aplysia californica]